ncbi:diguanylate cyclase [Pseudomarimonas arenosa]|uniref:diguanylate cyclase n=1 Tax=Pseudomarimonas arenosa TaxID=2774145 RepID=A0AAW3ZS37_9GAMM|nr:diguanylate cyclase [Pseudomarimonas arenosa]
MNSDVWRQRYEDLEQEGEAKAKQFERLESLLRRIVLRLSLAARGLSEPLDRVLERTSEAMRKNHGERELEPLLNQLTDAVANADTPAVSKAKTSVEPPSSDELKAALHAVLGQLELDSSLSERVQELGNRIGSASKVGEMASVCTELADVLSAQREHVRIEKADVQRLLIQVDSQLNEFVGFLRGDRAEREAAAVSRDELDQQMQGEVRELAQSVRSASDLPALQAQVSQRLRAMQQHLTQFKSREVERAENFRQRAERMSSRVEQLESETRQLQASLAREHANATTDALTGVPNRFAFNQRIALEFKRWKRFGRPLSLVLWDIDRFKAVNDTHGHAAGDQVIKAFAKSLSGSVRETDFLARYGGEEFVMLLIDTPVEMALKVCEKVRESVERMGISSGAAMIRITASAGLACFAAGDEPDQVIERADQALYKAKNGGRNRCEQG